MFSTVQDTVLQLLPSRRRNSGSGWISFNAVCCVHRGHNPDSRSRGGLIANTDGTVTYHCFNCQFKVSHRPGWALGYKFRRFLSWLGADENTISRLVIEAVRVRELQGIPELEPEPAATVITPRNMPANLAPLDHDPAALAYVQERKIDWQRYGLMTSSQAEYNLNRRIIIPFTWQDQLIGYSARAWDPAVRPKYHSNYDAGYVYNLDQQLNTAKFVIVTEGPFDAMSINGVAILSNNCSEAQAELIEQLNKEIIVVPDRDRAGQQLISAALDYGWSVSFPVWQETCKDVNEAVVRYGAVFVLKSILAETQTSKLKIILKRKRLYN